MITSAGSTRRPFRRLIAGSSVAIIALVLGWFPHLAAQTSAAIGHHSEAISRTTQPAASLPTLPDYIISPDDVLIIGVYDAPDITGECPCQPHRPNRDSPAFCTDRSRRTDTGPAFCGYRRETTANRKSSAIHA